MTAASLQVWFEKLPIKIKQHRKSTFVDFLHDFLEDFFKLVWLISSINVYFFGCLTQCVTLLKKVHTFVWNTLVKRLSKIVSCYFDLTNCQNKLQQLHVRPESVNFLTFCNFYNDFPQLVFVIVRAVAWQSIRSWKQLEQAGTKQPRNFKGPVRLWKNTEVVLFVVNCALGS